MLDERYQGEIAGEVVNTEHERQRPFMLLRPAPPHEAWVRA
jgi:hypothetical protein